FKEQTSTQKSDELQKPKLEPRRSRIDPIRESCRIQHKFIAQQTRHHERKTDTGNNPMPELMFFHLVLSGCIGFTLCVESINFAALYQNQLIMPETCLECHSLRL